jgi:hypothetical protein
MPSTIILLSELVDLYPLNQGNEKFEQLSHLAIFLRLASRAKWHTLKKLNVNELLSEIDALPAQKKGVGDNVVLKPLVTTHYFPECL